MGHDQGQSTSQVSGPVAGGTHGWPYAAAPSDLASFGYVEEEYFFEGQAKTYEPAAGGELSKDGRWPAQVSGTVPFRTRMLVRRPADPGRFNGTVVVFWSNVSSGFELTQNDPPSFFEGGFASVSVSAQAVGVHGYREQPQGLIAWDAERYGTLSIPTDDASYDIFTQAARLVGPKRPRTSVDPLGGLDVQRVVGQGGSQSAARLMTYFNAVHPLENAFDGFMLLVSGGIAAPLAMPEGQPFGASIEELVVSFDPPSSILRNDLELPVFVVNSESEVLSSYPVRQPDGEWFRFWEVAGTCHTGDASGPFLLMYQRDWGDGGAGESGEEVDAIENPNTVPWQRVDDAALHQLHQWLTAGKPPPHHPLISVAGTPPEIERDAHGNAVGGVRLPQLEAPIATLLATAEDGTDNWVGTTIPFPPEKLRALYPEYAAYVSEFTAAAGAAVQAGVLLPKDAERLIAEAAAARQESK